MFIDPHDPFLQLLRDDKRYRADAYLFLWEALKFAQEELKMGKDTPSEPLEDAAEEEPEKKEPGTREPQRHVTGQDLCEAIRQYALHQYGYMAKLVLNNWGLHTTGDFGEIVFNLIAVGQMRKTHSDRREDFDDVYDFDEAFKQRFKIKLPH